MPGPNLLIGSGETLTAEIPREPGYGREKAYPYSIEEARERLAPQLTSTIDAIRSVPAGARPRGEAVSLVTVHPAFLSKSQMPGEIFETAGLRSLGSKATYVVPGNDVRRTIRAGAQLAADLYLAGTEQAFADLLALLLHKKTKKGLQQELQRIERIRLQGPEDRILRITEQQGRLPIEIVLHGDGADEDLLGDLGHYARQCDAMLSLDKRFAVPGLVFIPGVVEADRLDNLAQFSAIRAVRRLPTLRMHRPETRQLAALPVPALPELPPVDEDTRVIVFDGGLGIDDFDRWASEKVPAELETTNERYLLHGTNVTSTLLFGEVAPGATELGRPYFSVEHHRVIGHDVADVDFYECMRRIDAVLSRGNVKFCNLSLGPKLPIDDEHPHAWTCMLDRHLASGECLATIAVGNDGDLDGDDGRIQVPSDAVNALAVGAATSRGFMWDRAPYSSRGPGRSPGLVKPDGLAFGGCGNDKLVVINPALGLCALEGTSYAAPLAMRVAAGAAAVSETKLSATALRALLIHKSEIAGGHKREEVGWGRFPQSVDELLTCGEHEATVLYQGSLTAGTPLRATLPIPAVPMGTHLSVKATFCFASTVDPADSLNYTRHGLTIVFRPRGDGSSDEFFSSRSYGSEDDLRMDAHKWETVLHRSRSWRAEDLLAACFDIQHGARVKGRKVRVKDVPPLPYVLIVTITSDARQPIYNSVLQRYRTLQPIRLRSRLQL